MNYNQTPQSDFSWGHCFVIAVVLGFCLWIGLEKGLIRRGKQPPVNYSEVEVKGFPR